MNSNGEHSIEVFFRRWATSFDELCASYRDALGKRGEWVAGPAPIPTTQDDLHKAPHQWWACQLLADVYE